MKKCPALTNIKFDQKSVNGIDRIKELNDLTKMGRWALAIGHLYSIFGGSTLRSANTSGVQTVLNLSNPTLDATAKASVKAISSEAGQTAYSISQANWEYFFESFSALDKIKVREIEKLALRQAFEHVGSPKEYAFWRAIEQGCKP